MPGERQHFSQASTGDWDAPRPGHHRGALIKPFARGISDRPPLPYWSSRVCHPSWRCCSPDGPAFWPRCRASHRGWLCACTYCSSTQGATEIPARLQAYQKLRLGRTSRIQAASRLAGRFFRSADGNLSERAEKLREWMSAAAWIFPYDTEEAAATFLQSAI